MTSSDPLELCDSRNTTSRFALNIMLSDFNLKCLEYKKGKRLDKKKKRKIKFPFAYILQNLLKKKKQYIDLSKLLKDLKTCSHIFLTPKTTSH